MPAASDWLRPEGSPSKRHIGVQIMSARTPVQIATASSALTERGRIVERHTVCGLGETSTISFGNLPIVEPRTQARRHAAYGCERLTQGLRAQRARRLPAEV